MTDKPPSMVETLEAALRSATLRPCDDAAVQLARRYAELIDNAAPAAKYRRALELVALPMRDAAPKTIEAFHLIVDALAQHSVASDLGPKYLAALQQLGMTPGRRASTKDKADDSGDTESGNDKPVSPLDRLRNDLERQRAKRRGAG